MTDDVLTTLEAAAALKCTERRVQHIPRRCPDETGFGDHVECSCGWMDMDGPWPDHLPDPAERIFAALRELMSEPGCGYIDFTWHPTHKDGDPRGAEDARALAQEIASRLR